MVVDALRAWNDGCDYAVTGGLLGRALPVMETNPCARIQAPRKGTLRNLFVRITSPPGAPASNVIFTVFLNGVPTTLVVTIVHPALAGSDVVNSVVVAKGDLVSVAIGGNFTTILGGTRADAELA